LNKDLTRSKVVAEMLAERSRDETFERSQTILVPIIQDTMRAEFHVFENRFLGIIARLSYKMGWLFSLTRQFVSLTLSASPALFHRIDDRSETDARVHVSVRTVQIDEVKHRLQDELEK
jgi:hypothetical protein